MIKHMKENDKIYVAGHLGLAGSAICRKLHELGFGKIITRTSTELDLRNQAAVEHFFAQEKPNYVFLAAAKVGGIYANNTYPADFIRDNLQIQTNVIDSSYKNGVKKGTIEGHDFKKALFGIWLGDNPADSGLKTGLLGK